MSEFVERIARTHWTANGEPVNTILRDEEIVRCRDCKKRHRRLEIWGGEMKHWCKLLSRYVSPNGFCAWGKRKS